MSDFTEPHTETRVEKVGNDRSFNLQPLNKILDGYKRQKGAVIPILQQIQEGMGIYPKKSWKKRRKTPGFPSASCTVWQRFMHNSILPHVAVILSGFAMAPPAMFEGLRKTIQSIENAFEIVAGNTSADFKYTLEVVYCVGSCGLAPVAVVDDTVHGHTKPEPFVRVLKKLE